MPSLNGLKARLDAGEVALGAEVTTGSPTLIEVLGDAGVDFVWADLEHQGGSPYDSDAVEHRIRAAEVAETELVLRLPAVDPPAIRKVLDAGVRTVLVPRVETAEEVRRAVRAARFWVEGEPGDRGLGKGRANRWGTDMAGYVQRQDESVLVGAMIENLAAVDDIEDIVSVPGLGFVFVGPWDISQAAGHPMATDHQAVADAVETVRAACRGADLPYGGYFPDPDDARAAAQKGAQILLVGDDVSAVKRTVSERLQRLRGADPTEE
jgi:2-dehydro-3-deoxyglucarate aldolase